MGLTLLAIGQQRATAAFGRITRDARDPRLARASNSRIGPALLGVFRPTVVLPADFEAQFSPGEQAMILAHEQAHLAAGHTLINALTEALRIFNWFNPLVHLGARYARIDQELACDAAVVGRFPGERRTYGEALLKTQLDPSPVPLGCSWPGRSPNLLEERIEMLAKPKPTPARLMTGAAAVVALTSAAALTAWAAEPPVVQYAQAQGAVGAALGAPAQARAAAPTAGATVKAGVGAPIDPALAVPVPQLEVAAFQKYFDGNAPLLVHGKVVRVEFTDTYTYVMVRDDTGKLYWVQGGRSITVSPEMRAAMEAMVGESVTVKAYNGRDGQCDGACLINGRDIARDDGLPLATPEAQAAMAAAQARAGSDMTRVLLSGGAGTDVAAAYFNALRTAPTPGASGVLYQLPNGAGVGVRLTDGYTTSWIEIPNSAAYPGLASLPAENELPGTRRPPVQDPGLSIAGSNAANQVFLAGGSAQEAAKAFLATGASPGQGGDITTARYFRAPSGGVGLGTRPPGGVGYDYIVIPNSQNFPGLANLPTAAEAFPAKPAR